MVCAWRAQRHRNNVQDLKLISETRKVWLVRKYLRIWKAIIRDSVKRVSYLEDSEVTLPPYYEYKALESARVIRLIK